MVWPKVYEMYCPSLKLNLNAIGSYEMATSRHTSPRPNKQELRRHEDDRGVKYSELTNRNARLKSIAPTICYK